MNGLKPILLSFVLAILPMAGAKAQDTTTLGGDVYASGSAGGFRVFYAPDFESADRDPHYGLIDGVKACLFELRVTARLARRPHDHPEDRRSVAGCARRPRRRRRAGR